VHCDTCSIDFKVNFERSVELKFHPNPVVRSSIASRVTLHMVVQQLLDPGVRRTVKPRVQGFEEERFEPQRLKPAALQQV
jgi:hypothetical protein